MSKRRANGEGTITKRKDGRWEGRLFLGYAGSRRKYKFVHAPTRDEVARRLAELRHS
jgi:hypothetical protein